MADVQVSGFGRRPMGGARIGGLPPPPVQTPPAPVARAPDAFGIPVRGQIVNGVVTHMGRPVEFGAEKEFPYSKLTTDGVVLANTRPRTWRKEYVMGVSAEGRRPAAARKPQASLTWSDLNDKGKAEYMKAYKTARGSAPILNVVSQSTAREMGIRKFTSEPTDDVEIVSKKFSSPRQLKVFLDKFGWGHIHTSFIRGGTEVEHTHQESWHLYANFYMFLSALERRDIVKGTPKEAGIAKGANWPFAIKGLAVPTKEHVQLAGEMIRGRNMTATAFSKHQMLGLRTKRYENDQKVIELNRIGYEARGGLAGEKDRVVNSLCNALVSGRWGREPEARQASSFKPVSVPEPGRPLEKHLQVKELPAEFGRRISDALAAYPVAGLVPEDGQRLHRLVASARFYDVAGAARLNQFDQRACMPVLNYEDIPWLSEGERAKAIEARSEFISKLSELEKRATATGMRPTETSQEIASLISEWAKQASLAEPFGRWLDGETPLKLLS